MSRAYADNDVESGHYFIGHLHKHEFQSILYLLERAALAKTLLIDEHFQTIEVNGIRMKDEILDEFYTVGCIAEQLHTKINILNP